jgi:hypothetical protein
MFISVKTVEGRIAYTAARGGERIPNDRYVVVEKTPWISRLLSVHKDIEIEPAPVAAKEKAAPASFSKAPAAPESNS